MIDNCSDASHEWQWARQLVGARLAILSAVQMNLVGQIHYFYGSFCKAGVGEGYFYIIEKAKGGFNFIGPFYEDDGVGGAEVVEADGFEIGGRIDAIGVDMENIEPAVVFVDQDESGAGDSAGAVFRVQARGDAFDEMRFSTAEGAGDSEYFAAGKLLAYYAAEGYGFSGGVCDGFERHHSVLSE